MKTIEVKAKTEFDAIESACDQLGVSQDQIADVTVVKGGMFSKTFCVTIKDEEPTKTVTKVANDSTALSSEKTLVSAELAKENEEPKPIMLKQSSTPQVFASDKAVESRNPSLKFTKTEQFIRDFLVAIDNDSTVTTEEVDDKFNINVTGENIGRLIGKGGVVMNALQTIVSSIAISHSNGNNTRVYVNIGNYKEKRTDSLTALAMKKAEYVKRTGKFAKLDPMNARERAMVHSALSSVEGVKTYSTGKEPFRCLCIAPDDGTEAKSKSDTEIADVE